MDSKRAHISFATEMSSRLTIETSDGLVVAVTVAQAGASPAMVEALKYVLELEPIENWSPQKARELARAALKMARVLP